MLSSDAIEQLLIELFSGSVNERSLPRDLYRETATHLFSSVEKGFGKTFENVHFQSPDYEALKSFENNIYRFSGAKTFQQVYEIQQKIFDEDGYKRNFSAFKEDAFGIMKEFSGSIMEDVPDKYTDYLKTESNTAFSQAQSAQSWKEFEEQKETLPYLIYRTVGDGRVRDEHAILEGIAAPVDDPIWDEIAPEKDWNCRCYLEQSDNVELTSKDDIKSRLEKVDFNPTFDFNPGKEFKCFSDAHPYFNVPEKYQEFKDNNFNLPLPKFEPPSLPTFEKQIFESVESLKAQYSKALEANDFDKIGEISKKLAENAKRVGVSEYKPEVPKFVTKEFESDKKAQEYYREQKSKFNDFATSKVKKSIDNYIEDSTPFNTYLRAGGNVSSNIKGDIKVIDELFTKKEAILTDDLTLKRIVNKTDFFEKLKVGDIYQDKGYVSTTLSDETKNFIRASYSQRGSIQEIEIIAEKGSKAIPIDFIYGAGNAQYEYLLQGGSKYEVIEKTLSKITVKLL